jgi:hypothetical protein
MMQLNQQAKIGQHIVEGNVQTNNQEENDFFFDANNFVDNLRCKPFYSFCRVFERLVNYCLFFFICFIVSERFLFMFSFFLHTWSTLEMSRRRKMQRFRNSMRARVLKKNKLGIAQIVSCVGTNPPKFKF